MSRADLTRLIRDARVSDSARMLGLYLRSLGPGPHRLTHDEMAAVLYGTPSAETVRRHLRQLQVHHYIRLEENEGGRGRGCLLTWTGGQENPLTSEGESTNPLKNEGVSGPHTYETRSEPLTTPSTPAAPTPAAVPAQPETPEHPYAASIRKLSGMLGVDPEPLYAIRSRNNWAEHVIGGYARQDCPAEPIVGRCSLEMRRRAVALALSRFAADGDEYSNPYFRKYVEAALRDVAAPEPGANGNGRVGGHHAGNGHGAASVSLADLKALVRAGGDMLRLDAGRRVVLPRLQRECAELWARAGPAFERLDFRELVPVIANDFALTQALRGQLERLDYRAA